MKQMSILTDVTQCIGCEKCVAACKSVNHTGEDHRWRWQKHYTDLSASRWTTIVRKKDNEFIRKQCRHCLEPSCVSVCPVGALHKTPEGAVIYDSDICMGCRYCMMACPFGIPRYTWDKSIPYVRKCILCYDKIKSGELKQPACTAACPTHATIYGKRDDLLKEAHRRLKEHPERYSYQKVWGEHEVGGTSVLYLSNTDLSFLNWKPDLGDKAFPLKTWGTLKTVPYIFLGVGIAMYGIHWAIGRRMEGEEVKTQSALQDKENENAMFDDNTDENAKKNTPNDIQEDK